MSAFAVPMQFEGLLGHEHDSTPKLPSDDHSLIDHLVANYVKWSDPDDSTIELA